MSGQCNNVLRKEGRVYPRTCAECGLGPCKRPIVVARIELDAVKATEAAITKALLHLEEDSGKSIDSVEVDTRNFGRLAVEITLTDRKRQ